MPASWSRDALDRGTDALVVVGGDGVISIALQALAGGDVPLGVIPAGTGNDHAREYGLPTGDPVAAADIVADGHDRDRRPGPHRAPATAPQKWFGTVAATGFDSLVSDRANRMRWPHGRMRYNVAMIAELSKLRLLPFRLVFDGGERWSRESDAGRVRQHPQLRRRHADLPRRRPRPTACWTSRWSPRRHAPG